MKQLKLENQKAKEDKEFKKMFHPKICEQSKKLVGSKGGTTSFQALYEEAQALKDKRQKIVEAEKAKKEQKEMQDVTFKPKLNKRKKSPNIESQFSSLENTRNLNPVQG